MSFVLKCSVCDELVIKSVNNEIKVRAKVFIVRDDITHAVCKGCSTEIPIPLKYDEDLAKSQAKPQLKNKGPRLYLSK